MGIGAKIKNLRKSAGISGKKFATALGISPSFLSQVEHEKKEASGPLIRLIEEKFKVNLRCDVDEHWLRTGQGQMDAAEQERHTVAPRGERVTVIDRHAKGDALSPDVQNLLNETLEILTSGTGYAEALTQNIHWFHNAVKNGKETDELRTQFREAEKRSKAEIARLQRDLDAIKQVLNPDGPPGDAKET